MIIKICNISWTAASRCFSVLVRDFKSCSCSSEDNPSVCSDSGAPSGQTAPLQTVSVLFVRQFSSSLRSDWNKDNRSFIVRLKTGRVRLYLTEKLNRITTVSRFPLSTIPRLFHSLPNVTWLLAARLKDSVSQDCERLNQS